MSTKGKVKGIISNLVIIAVDGPVAQNEICYIETGNTKLMAEVIKIIGDNAYAQVFESTRGLQVGAEAEFMGHMWPKSKEALSMTKTYGATCN